MDNKTRITPNRNVINGVKAPLLEKAISQKRKQQQSKSSLIWGTVNIGLLGIILYDILHTCPLHTSYIQYIEYVGAIILLLNIVYHFGRYLMLNLPDRISSPPLVSTCLTASPPGTPINKIQSTPEINTPNLSMSTTPMNTSALSWLTNSTPNSSFNYPVKSDSWLYSSGTPQPQNISPMKTPRQDTSGIEFISDQNTLQTYLKDFEANEKKANITNCIDATTNALSTFWSHPLTKNPKDTPTFLKRTQYQLSPATTTLPLLNFNQTPTSCSPPSIPNYYYGLFPQSSDDLEAVISIVQHVSKNLISQTASSTNSPKTDDKGSPSGSTSQGMETWRRLSVDVITLTQWNANLRMWLSQTILMRLIKEFDNIDDALQKHGLTDILVGKVGLDRIRKTAQTALVLQFIPTLPAIIPFLELTPNQEYLVKRIRELAKGGCMSEFRWNSGSSFNGKDWDNSLPTDSAIMMHLFASYLDTQLLPLPNQPDVKPFSGYHYLKQGEKLPNLTNQSLLIQQCSDSPPYYRVVIGEEIYELVKGYNNLFHCILLFLYHVNKRQDGMVGRVNLGRSGLNMLWIIQS
ncbi:Cytochrome B561, N terminal [Popillia japonica]|uniref:Cytochrome B561, N terminal n=1 Tax=Popillia japonica TaxID=7064 RepID=A0AAW1MHF0_POPJA